MHASCLLHAMPMCRESLAADAASCMLLVGQPLDTCCSFDTCVAEITYNYAAIGAEVAICIVQYCFSIQKRGAYFCKAAE